MDQAGPAGANFLSALLALREPGGAPGELVLDRVDRLKLLRTFARRSRSDHSAYRAVGTEWEAETSALLKFMRYLFLVYGRHPGVSAEQFEKLVVALTPAEREEYEQSIECGRAYLGNQDALKRWLKEMARLYYLGPLLPNRSLWELIGGTDYDGTEDMVNSALWALAEFDNLRREDGRWVFAPPKAR
jgi:hypothetical protein